MSAKTKVGIIFGGQSAEHEVSLQSAKSIMEAIDRNKYEVLLIGIDKQGQWHLNEHTQYLLNSDNPKLIQLNKSNDGVALIPGGSANPLLNTSTMQSVGEVDVVFPVLHGPMGEDGTVQGMLKLAGIPFVGSGVLGSAVSMDKDVSKRLLRDAGLSIANFITLTRADADSVSFTDVKQQLGLPLFIKPANLGSSVGVNKVNTEEQFAEAVKEALQFDHKVIVEQFVDGREIECSVLGNADPVASVAGEILPQEDFYSYEAKYIDESGALLAIPADLPSEMMAAIQSAAVDAFRALNCEGLARVDFFLQEDGKILVNEINTLPGFTKISMYPKLWEASGLSYSDLINRLIELALERHQLDSKLKQSHE